MYLGVTAVTVGQPELLLYAAAVAGATAAFAHGYEEPTLCRQFGAQFEAYRRAVPAWWPRRHSRQPGQATHPPARIVIAAMGDLLDYTPIAAAAFAIPQFLPQIVKLRRTDDAAGVSWPWAALTSVNNAAWIAYFAASAYWAALVPASSATLLAGALATMLARRGQAKTRPVVLIGAWAALLAVAFILAGRAGLGALLTTAFVLQVTPSLWTAYRTTRPTGISRGTWLLILGELSCWTVFGVHKSDPRLMILGPTGVTASLLMLARIRPTSNRLQRRRDLSRLAS